MSPSEATGTDAIIFVACFFFIIVSNKGSGFTIHLLSHLIFSSTASHSFFNTSQKCHTYCLVFALVSDCKCPRFIVKEPH